MKAAPSGGSIKWREGPSGGSVKWREVPSGSSVKWRGVLTDDSSGERGSVGQAERQSWCSLWKLGWLCDAREMSMEVPGLNHEWKQEADDEWGSILGWENILGVLCVTVCQGVTRASSIIIGGEARCGNGGLICQISSWCANVNPWEEVVEEHLLIYVAWCGGTVNVEV